LGTYLRAPIAVLVSIKPIYPIIIVFFLPNFLIVQLFIGVNIIPAILNVAILIDIIVILISSLKFFSTYTGKNEATLRYYVPHISIAIKMIIKRFFFSLSLRFLPYLFDYLVDGSSSVFVS
jgi:hypothetical protein